MLVFYCTNKWVLEECYLLREFSVDPADILFEDLSVPDLLLHISCLFRIAAKHEEPRCEPVQPVDRPQVLQVVFLGKDENHSVVTISATWMDLEKWKSSSLEMMETKAKP